MKVAIISDIHSNLIALEAVMDSIRDEGVDRIFCLGDIVGYGARPNECVEMIQYHNIPCVMGNHDEAAIGLRNIGYFNQWARAAVLWTSDNLNDNSRRYLGGLEFTLEHEGMLFVHSSPFEPQAWHYIFTDYEASASFRCFKQRVGFIGHSHIPDIFSEPGSGRLIVNVGSVGQPRDHDPRACWGLYDTDSNDFKWMRVEYRFAETSAQIIAAGLPGFLADRLRSGI